VKTADQTFDQSFVRLRDRVSAAEREREREREEMRQYRAEEIDRALTRPVCGRQRSASRRV